MSVNSRAVATGLWIGGNGRTPGRAAAAPHQWRRSNFENAGTGPALEIAPRAGRTNRRRLTLDRISAVAFQGACENAAINGDRGSDGALTLDSLRFKDISSS